VAFVDPVIDAGSGLFRVRLVASNADLRIKPGFEVDVRFRGDGERAAAP
jgi:multidrug efflux pump subunit AcrA (membrane-fusion protein)